MINLKQDTDGNVRMSRIFPSTVAINITFTDGSQEVTTGGQMNKLYDAALAEFRLRNGMDAKGFSHTPVQNIHRKNAIGFVPVKPGLGQ